MKLLVIIVSLLLVPIASLTQANSQEQIPSLSIRGKVLQDSGEQPIKKANALSLRVDEGIKFLQFHEQSAAQPDVGKLGRVPGTHRLR